MKTVLFACVHNAGRSQMAAALFNVAADASAVRAISAGTAPTKQVHPEVVTAMREVGIDLTDTRPQRLTPELAARVDLLITMGCEGACPVLPDLERLDWQLTDPKGRSLEEVRGIREDIGERVERLLTDRGWNPIRPRE